MERFTIALDEGLASAFDSLVAERGDLPVFLLHDATPAGMEIESRVRSAGLLPLTTHPVIDLGITPADARRLKRLSPVRPQQIDYSVPVDLILFAGLSVGLTQAVSERATLAAIMNKADAAAADTSSGFG